MASKLLKGIDPLPRATLSEQVAKRLAASISAGEWQPGQKLPSESELCRAFQVGRSSLREALTSLAFIGLIRMRAGGGSYVAEQPSAYLTSGWLKTGLLTSPKAIADFSEVRLVLEAEVAALCAERITPEELAGLTSLVERMKAAVDSDEFPKLDLAFHLSVSEAAKNQVLRNILASVRESTRELIAKSLLLSEGKQQAAQQHARILESFRQRNPARAREAMRAHLLSFQRGYNVLFADARLNTQDTAQD